MENNIETYWLEYLDALRRLVQTGKYDIYTALERAFEAGKMQQMDNELEQ